VVVVAAILAVFLANPSVYAQQEQKFNANLTGQEEVPPVQTQATGNAGVSVSGDNVTYNVNATNIQGATMGHIHIGKQGENGPPVVTLFKYPSPQSEVSENGTITPDKLEGPMQGKQISDLVTAMSNGTSYVNIHTVNHPPGEIRGQVTSAQ
jgi:hypothetical protein